MPAIRFTFEAQDKDVEALLGRIQQSLRQVKAEEAGAANEFSAIVAGARAALAAATEQVQVQRAALQAVRERGQAEIAAAKAARDAATQAAQATREASREAVAQARETATLARNAAREQVAGARQVLTTRRQALQAAQAEEAVIRRQSSERVSQARLAANEARRRLEDAQSVLNDLRITQRSRAIQGGQTPEDAALARQQIQDQREIVELLRLEAQEKRRTLETTKDASKAARDEARVKTEAARAALTAARNEVRAKEAELKATREAGNESVRQAQKAAAAAVQQGRANVAAANQTVAAARRQAQANTTAATQGLAQARAQQTNAQAALGAARAQQQLARAQQQASSAGRTHADVIGRLTQRLVALFAAVQGARLFARFINEGLKFNQVIETATLAIASLVDAEGTISVGGRPVRDMEKLAIAVDLTRQQVVKLRIAGLQTAATTEQLVDAFQQAVGAGLAAGLTLDEIRKITVQVTQAAAALGVPLNQINQEVRSILDATIDRNSRVARVLGITNEQVRAMKQEGTLFDFLNQKMKAFTDAGVEAASTWQVIKSNMKEALDVFAGDATKPLFDNLKKGFEGALNAIFDFDTARVSGAFSGLIGGLQTIFGKVGELLGAAIAKTLSGAKILGDWFEKNRVAVKAVVDETANLVVALAGVLGSLINIVAKVVEWGVQSGFIVGFFRTVENLARAAAIIINALTNKWVLMGAAIVANIASVGALNVALRSLGATLLANPAVLIATALAGLVLVINTVIARNEQLRAKQEEVRKEFEKSLGVVIDLTAEYAKLAKQIDSGRLTGDALLEAQDQLVAKAKELATADARYAALLDPITRSVTENAAASRELRKEHEELTLEQDKLNAALKNGGLSEKDAAAKRARLAQITRDLKKNEDDYRKVQVAGKGEYRAILEQLSAVTKERLNEVEAMFNQAKAAEALMRIQVVQARVARDQAFANLAGSQRSKDDAQKRLENLEEGARAVGVQVTTLQNRFIAAKKAAEDLDKALTAPDIVLTGNERPDDRNRKSHIENDARQMSQAEIKIIKANLEKTEAELKEEFARHELSIGEYYQRLINANEKAIDAQIASHRKLMSKLSDPGDRQRELAEITALETEKGELRAKFGTQQLNDERELQQKISQARIDLLEAEGNQADAQIERMKKQFGDLKSQLEAELLAGNTSVAPALDIVNKLLDVNIFKIRIQEVHDLIAQFKTDLSTELQDIASRVQAGTLSQSDAAKATVQAYKDIILQLNAYRLSYKVLADELNDPKARKAIQLLQAAINALQGPLRQAEDAVHSLRNAIFSGFTDSLSEFLSSGIDQAKSFGDAWRAVALSIVNSLRQIIAQIVAYKIAAAVFNAVGVGIPTGSAPPGARTGGLITPMGATMPAFRDGGVVERDVVRHIKWIRTLQDMPRFGVGGKVRGPGTGTSDSITAKLSHGEYVIRASKVRQYGVDFFDEINFGRRGASPRRRRRAFADGGAVEAGGGAGSASVDQVLGRLEVALSSGLETKLVKSRSGRRAVLQVLQEHPREVKRLLGLGK